jgi:hypothetical protein
MRRSVEIFIAVSVMLGIAPSAQATSMPVMINEIDCHHNDWIELVNTSSKSVDVSNWILTDKEPNVAKVNHRYVFTAGTITGSHKYLVVQQSGVGREHLPFGIPCAGGQTVYLSKPSVGALYSTVDSAPVPKIPVNVVYGRIPTGTCRFSLTFGTKAGPNKSALPQVVGQLLVNCRKNVTCAHQLKATNVTSFSLDGKASGVSISRTGLVKLLPSKVGKQSVAVEVVGPYGTSLVQVTIATN